MMSSFINMDFLRRIFFEIWYFRNPPWDSGQTPPELLALLPGLTPARAIDLGCGTGTNVITLAKMGWQATGVDFSARAIQLARQKAQKAAVQADFFVGDVTDLRVTDKVYDFALDLGCFHGLPLRRRADYVRELKRILRPGGLWFLYSFLRSGLDESALGLAEADLGLLLADFSIVSRQDGFARGERPSAYFTFQKK